MADSKKRDECVLLFARMRKVEMKALLSTSFRTPFGVASKPKYFGQFRISTEYFGVIFKKNKK